VLLTLFKLEVGIDQSVFVCVTIRLEFGRTHLPQKSDRVWPCVGQSEFSSHSYKQKCNLCLSENPLMHCTNKIKNAAVDSFSARIRHFSVGFWFLPI